MDFHPVLNAVIFAVLGIAIFAGSFALLDAMTPYDLWKQLCEERNTALAIVVGAAALGICIIIAAAVH
jgi:putative membrane protein